MDKVESNKTFIDTYGNHANKVVFGNPDVKDEFQTHVKMEFWIEDYISFCEEGIKGEPTLENEIITLDLPNLKEQWYKTDESIKWIFTFKNKPTTNKYQLKLGGNWKDFDFLFQRSLLDLYPNDPVEYYTDKDGEDCLRITRQEEIVSRGLKIEKSYAVYHKTKRDYVIGHKNYRHGKALHIFRPKATDSTGKFVWTDLHIEDGIYTVTIPQEFLDKAVYPITVNDDFGYQTTTGSPSSINPDNEWALGPYACPATGDATSVSIYCTGLSDTTVTWGIWTDVSNYPSVLVGNSTGTTENDDGWVTKNVTGSLSIANYYIGGNCGANKPTLVWDEDASYERNYKGVAYSAGSLSNPYEAGANAAGSRKYAAYVTYTPTPVGAAGIMTTNTGFWGPTF